MKYGFCLGLMLSLGFAVSAQTRTAQPARSDKDSITAKVDQVFAGFDKPDSPGCALAVIKDTQIVYKRGYGMSNLEHEIPISPSSIFHVASISKEFTAMAIVLLAQQGKLSLDDDIRKYVSEVPDFGERITIRHLIHHTSGLRDQWSLLEMAGWREDDVITEKDILELLSRQKALNFKPGDEYLYSNTGYTLLAVIVKRVSGKSLREFAEENIFKPLGMTRTHFHDDHGMIVKDRTSAYQPRKGGGLRISIPVFDTYGATSLFTTVEDMARWDRNFVDKKIGGEAAIDQMLTLGVLNSGKKQTYAFGLTVGEYKGLKTVGHGGSDAGYRGDFLRFPDQRFSVVCLCNLSTSNPSALTRRVADVYLADQLKTEAARPPSPTPVVTLTTEKPTEQELAGKAGVYVDPKSENTLRLEIADGKLMILAGPGSQLVPINKDRFQVSGAPVTVTFEGSLDGHPQRMLVLNESEKEPTAFEFRGTGKLTSAQLDELAGVYYSDELDTRYTVVVKDDRLALRRKKFEDATLAPTSTDVFTAGNIGAIKFLRDLQGHVSGFEINAGRVRHLRFTREPR